jgi:hypothetical protein
VPSHADTLHTLRRVTALAKLLDARFTLPGTRFRFGLDPLIGLLPVAGGTVSLAIGLYIVREAVRHRVPLRVVTQMLSNLGVDWALGIIPVIGVVPDALFKANARNAMLLSRALQQRVDGGAADAPAHQAGDRPPRVRVANRAPTPTPASASSTPPPAPSGPSSRSSSGLSDP